MAIEGKSKLRRWECPAGSGIKIREIINRTKGTDYSISYRITIPARIAGRRTFMQFRSFERAERWAKEQYEGALRNGQKHFQFSPSDREDAIAAMRILEGTGLTLSQAATLAKKHVQIAISARPSYPFFSNNSAFRLELIVKKCRPKKFIIKTNIGQIL